MTNKINNIFNYSLKKFLLWRVKNMPERRFIIIISLFIGILAGFTAMFLKSFTHFIQGLVSGHYKIFSSKYVYLILPFIGLVITYFVKKYFLKKDLGHGIPSVLYSISKKKSIMKPHQVIGALVTAPFTVGFGGSVGLEGPAVSTGSALGSRLANMFHLNYKARTLILACGAAGAMSAIFKVPIAAIIFTIEVFSIDLTLLSLIPLLISSGTAIIISYLFSGQNLTLTFYSQDVFNIKALPYYLILSLLSALVSIHFTKISNKIEHFFEHKIRAIWIKMITGGIIIGLIVAIFHSIYGEGYIYTNAFLGDNVEMVKSSIHFFEEYITNNWVFIMMLILMLYLKMIAVATTFGAGGIGGIFAPSLFMGSLLGFIFSKSINMLGANVSVSNFALVGMAGLIAGILHAPLTAIFLIVETTGGYSLIAPLMIVSAFSYLITKIFIKNSLYTDALQREGSLITHNKDKGILLTMNISTIIEKDFMPIDSNMNLRDLVKVISKSKRNVFSCIGF